MKSQVDRTRFAGTPLAVIEIGSTGIRMLVASVSPEGGFLVLDRAGKPSRIGRDVFTLGRIGREALREGIAVLASFRELLRGYGIAPAQVRVIGTSALREASNRDTFVDRVSIQIGFKVRIVEDIEENHLMYLAVQHAFQDQPGILTKSNAMIIEVGGGTTEIMLLKRGRMAAAHSLSIGTLRLEEQMRGSGASKSHIREFLENSIRSACDNLEGDLPLESVKNFIVIGSDARLAAGSVGGARTGQYAVLKREDFSSFAEKASRLSPEECVTAYHVQWSEAEGLILGLAIERMFLERTGAEAVIVPDISIREGLLLEESMGPDAEIEGILHSQVMASAAALGKRYKYDETHARKVLAASIAIFDALGAEHGLDAHQRLLLETAAILHDIGMFIRASGHHRHGEYIVSNSEIFGLNKTDREIVANIVRYHRKGPPSSSHLNFISLPREDRMTVMKLAAILRVADSLDRSHQGRVGSLSLEMGESRFTIRCADNIDLSLERLSLADKGDMFEDVFGLAPVLA